MKLTKQEGILVKIGTSSTQEAANDSVMVQESGWSVAGARMTDRAGSEERR